MAYGCRRIKLKSDERFGLVLSEIRRISDWRFDGVERAAFVLQKLFTTASKVALTTERSTAKLATNSNRCLQARFPSTLFTKTLHLVV